MHYYIFLNGYRGEKTPYESTMDLAHEKVESLYPTISMPISIAVIDLRSLDLFLNRKRSQRLIIVNIFSIFLNLFKLQEVKKRTSSTRISTRDGAAASQKRAVGAIRPF